MSGPIPLPDYSPTYGGDSGPAFSENGALNVSVGGLNVPAYPNFSSKSLAPVDADWGRGLLERVTSNTGDMDYGYLVAGLLVLVWLKNRR